MEFGAERYYRNSGAAPIGGVLLSLVLGSLAGALLGTLYGLLDWYNPYIYFTFLGAIGAAVGTGFAVVFGLSLGKVRNRLLGIVVGIFSGVVSIYTAWVVFLYFWGREAFGMGIFVFEPTSLISVMQAIAEVGLWENLPKGWGLYSMWIIEAMIFVGGSTIIAAQLDTPFCETCDTWADEHECGAGLQVPADLNELKRDLEDEQYTRLHELMQGSYDAGSFMQIKVWMCSHCEDSTWMTVEQMVSTTNAKGESNTATTAVVKYLTIPRQLGEELVSAVPRFGGGAEALLTDIPEGEREQPTSIPLAGDDGFGNSGDEDFWETKKT